MLDRPHISAPSLGDPVASLPVTEGPTVLDALAAIMAMGTDRWEAIGTLYPTDPVGVMAQIAREVVPMRLDLFVVEACDRIARSSPEAAMAAFIVWAKGHPGIGDIRVKDRAWLTGLPDGLEVHGDLTLRGNPNLADLPSGLRVHSKLDLCESPLLRRFPEDAWIGGSVCLHGCRGLEGLPACMRVRGSLWLDGCVGIMDLPDGLVVDNVLDLKGCNGITSLAWGLVVGEWLNLPNCAAWDGKIPEDAIIGGDIVTNLHPVGITLAEWRKLHPGGELDGHA